MQKSIIIIGGGILGATASYYLASAGHEVTDVYKRQEETLFQRNSSRCNGKTGLTDIRHEPIKFDIRKLDSGVRHFT